MGCRDIGCRSPIPLLLALACLLLPAHAARAQQDLVADLSDHLVRITTGFTGANVLLFGAVEGEGAIVVVVTGPRGPVTVRRKNRVAGIWANTEAVTFSNVPAYYAVAATEPLETLASPDVRSRQEIGLDNINLRLADRYLGLTDPVVKEFRDGLVRNNVARGLYDPAVSEIKVLSDRLFHTTIEFPANVATGLYTVSVYYIRDGNPVFAQTTPLSVSKVGIGADVFLFAHRNSVAYGLIAIAIAVGAGWLAAWIFRKV